MCRRSRQKPSMTRGQVKLSLTCLFTEKANKSEGGGKVHFSVRNIRCEIGFQQRDCGPDYAQKLFQALSTSHFNLPPVRSSETYLITNLLLKEQKTRLSSEIKLLSIINCISFSGTITLNLPVFGQLFTNIPWICLMLDYNFKYSNSSLIFLIETGEKYTTFYCYD